jgi:hypothetical protein
MRRPGRRRTTITTPGGPDLYDLANEHRSRLAGPAWDGRREPTAHANIVHRGVEPRRPPRRGRPRVPRRELNRSPQPGVALDIAESEPTRLDPDLV